MLTALGVALLVVMASVVVGLMFWHRWLRWWEVLLTVPAPVVVCLLVHVVAEYVVCADRDYVSSWIETVRYDEAWNERVTETETYTDSDGKTRTRTVTRTVEHPPEWSAHGAHGRQFGITRARFEQIVAFWRVPQRRIELNRNYHTRDGDRYEARFPDDDARLVPCTYTVTYRNPVLGAPSVFDYDRPVNGPVVAYPGYSHECIPSAIGAVTAEEIRAWDVANARLGVPHGVRLWVIVLQEQPVDAALDQETAWKGGHRSDLVIVVSVTRADRAVQWCHVFGWTKAETLKVRIRMQVSDQQQLDLVAVASWLRETIPGNYVQRDFSEFSYLPVAVPWWWYLVACFVAAVANVGMMMWLVKNDHHDAGRR